MATTAITPREWDEQGNPVQAGTAPTHEWDASGNPVGSSPAPASPTANAAPSSGGAGGSWEPASVAGELTSMVGHELFSGPMESGRLLKALIHSKMTGADPKLAYDHYQEFDKGFRDIASDYDAQVGKAAKSGLEETPLAMAIRGKPPEPFESHDALLNFIHDVSSIYTDPSFFLPMGLGKLAGFAKLGTLGGFALSAGLRKTLMDHYQKGDIKSPGDLASRAGSALWDAAKGAASGEAMILAGDIPVGKFLAQSPAAATLLKGLYQSTAMEVAGSVLNQRMPTLEGFERNAVLVSAAGLAGSIGAPEAKQGLMDVYTKDGTTPEQSAEKLQAQPPVKPEMKPGLQPAIRVTAKDGSKQVISGEDATHSDLAERVTGERPIGIDELEANPKLADKVLSQPEIQVQQVIDRAYTLRGPSGIAELQAPEDDPLPPKESLKSGRGFTTPSGDYLNRSQAKNWVKENEPDVHEMWKQGGDEDREFHSEDYMNAHKRVSDRTTLEGESQLTGVSQELTQFLAKNRESLNDIKAGNKSEGYGKSVIRTLFTGPRNMVHAQAEQVAGHIAKLIPDYIDQEALSFMRDYRDDPNELRSEIEEIRKGDNEKLKRAIPSMERALEPTPKMLEADKQMTEYFKQANDLRRQFVGVDSSIDPARYSPRNFMHAEDEESSVGRSKFSKRSPHDIRREYLRLLDPLKSGETEARTFNAVDELRIYGDRLGTSVGRNVLEMELKNSELGKHGVAGQVPAELKAYKDILSQKELEEFGGIPRDWVELPGTGKTVVSGDKQFRMGLQVPPKIAEAMRPILENDVISGAKFWKVAKMTQAYIKSIELGLSPFHMRALSLSFMNNEGVDAYRKALYTGNNSPEFEEGERDGALWGLTTTKTSVPYEAYQGPKPSSLEPRNTLLAKVKEGYAPVDAIFKGMTKATFDVAQRKFKVIGYMTRKAAWLAKNPNTTDSEYGTAMRSIAKEANAVYGGLNWDVLGVSKNFQAVGRMFLLAPDWTFSNVANLKYAFEGGPGGNAARMFWLKSFTTGYAMTQGMSLLLTGQMTKQWDKVYLGKDDKGKEMYSSMFFVGAPKDAIGTINSTMRDGFPIGTVEFALNKASPLVGTGVKLTEKTDWQGRPIIKRTDSFGEKSEKGLAFAGEQLLPAPFVIKDMSQRLMNPDEGLTYKDFLAGLVGAAVYHEGAKQGKQASLPGAKSSRGKFSIKRGQ